MKSGTEKNAIAVIGFDPALVYDCVARGLRTIMVRDVEAHLRGHAVPVPPAVEEIVVADLTDVGEIWAGLTRGLGDRPGEHLRGIVTFDEFAVSTTAALASLMGLPGLGLDRAVVMRDKHLQKEHVRRAGLSAAEARVVVPGSETVRVPFPGPCVVKPLAGGATTSTEVVRTEAEYEALLERLSTSATSPYVVEDLVDVGEEWIVDGVVQNGIVVFSSLGRYGEPCLAYTTDDVAPIRVLRMDKAGEDDRCAEARAFAGKALQALGYGDGVFHMELFLDRRTDTFSFGECAARVGGLLIQEIVQIKHGFSLASAGVDVALGEPVRGEDRDEGRFVGSTSLHLPRGTVIKLPDPHEFSAPEHIHEFRIAALLGVNDPPAVRATTDWQGICVVSAPSLEKLEARMNAAQRDFSAQSLVAPSFATGARQREFRAGHGEMLRKSL